MVWDNLELVFKVLCGLFVILFYVIIGFEIVCIEVFLEKIWFSDKCYDLVVNFLYG